MTIKLKDYDKLRPLTRREVYDLARQHPSLDTFGFQYPVNMAAKHRLEAYDRYVTFTQRLMHMVDVTNFSYNHQLKPYGGMEATIMSMPHFWSVEGMDPAHMKLVLCACPDDRYESVEEEVTNAGFSLRRISRGDTYEEALRYRPAPHAVMVNFAGYRDPSDHRWLYLDAKALDDMWGKEVFKGCARGHTELLHQKQAKAQCKAMAAHVRAVFAEESVMTTLTAKVLWREEEIGSASIGGVEIKPWGDKDHGRRVSECEQLCTAFLDTGIIGDALDEGKIWADSAVAKIAEQVAALTLSVALLPERARNATEALYEAQVLHFQRGRSTQGRKTG